MSAIEIDLRQLARQQRDDRAYRDCIHSSIWPG
jgi:hypothetical protein